jgi:hypothetical protein
MSGLSEEEINKMVNELVHNKESVSTEEKTESIDTTEEKQKQESIATNQELNKLMSGLFSELITTFIPPEVKNNKNFKMNKMMNMLLSTFEQSKNKETNTTDKDNSEENDSQSDNPSSEEEQPDEDTQSEEETSQSDDDDEEETSQSDNDEEENTETEDVTEPFIYVVLQNGTAIGYTSSFSTAEKKSIQLYKQFIFKNTTRYLRTEKSLGQITVYERNPHLLLPFLENNVFELSIVSLSEL